MAEELRAEYRIDAGTLGPSEARRIVASELGRLVGACRLEDLKLLVTELVNGRIRRRQRQAADTGDEPVLEGDELVLDLEAGEVIRCSVVDEGPPELPSEWAIRILDLLAKRWGVSRQADATRLWFETDAGR